LKAQKDLMSDIIQKIYFGIIARSIKMIFLILYMESLKLILQERRSTGLVLSIMSRMILFCLILSKKTKKVFRRSTLQICMKRDIQYRSILV